MDACPKFSGFGIDREYCIRDHAKPDDIPILDDFFKKMLDGHYDSVYFVDTDRPSFAGMPRRSGSRATLRPKSWAASVTITSAEMEGQAVDQLIRPSHRVDSGGEQPCEPVRGRYMGQAHRAGAQRGRQHV